MDPFELPDNLSELSSEELEALREQALAEAADIYENQPRTSEGLERIRSLRAATETIDGESTRRSELEAEMATEMSGLVPEPAASDEPAADPEPGDGDGDGDTGDGGSDDGEQPAEEPAPAPDPEPAPSAEPSAADVAASTEPAPGATPATPTAPEATPVSGDTTPTPAPSAEDSTPAPDQELATVAASANPPSAGQPSAAALNAHRPAATDPVTSDTTPERQATIVAAANLPDFPTGHELTLLDAAEAVNSIIRVFPKNGRAGVQRQSAFSIRKPFEDDEMIPEGADADAYFADAADETKLPGGSLVAAGGWCAPSETIYDLVSEETVDGILSLPSRQVARGGLKHTLGPDFRSIYDGSGFTFTEADDIAGDYQPSNPNATGKSCVVVPCPSFVEDRLDVAGLCITGGILQNVAYPEMTRRFIDGALVGHAHRLNSLVLDDLEAGSTGVSPTAFGSYTTSVLSAAELVATDIRYRHRMGQNQSLEAVFPIWAKGVIRADLSNRLGVNLLDVTDAMIDAWFRERKVNPQYVYDWQDDMIEGSGFGGETPITAWPTTVKFLIYRAGTWVKGESDVITIDMIYDSVNLPANNYTALFTEEGWMTMKRRHDSRVVTVTGYNDFGDTNAGTAAA